MRALWTTLLIISGAGLTLYVAHSFCLFLLSLLANARARALPSPTAASRIVVVVPAHDEELLIEQTVRSILDANYEGTIDLIVIADNCTDKTAEFARRAGAQCLERRDETHRGKPYALQWAISRIDMDRYDALVIIDADTRVHPKFFSEMNRGLAVGQEVLQGYFGVLNPDQNWLTRLSLLPATLKFRLQFPGKELLGLSCPLAGNGMCFAAKVIKRYGWNAYSLTENWEYWAMLTLDDITVHSAPDAIIYSQVAKSLEAGQSQRLRWMRGRAEVARLYASRLLWSGLRRANLAKLDAFVEITKPTHATLVIWSTGYLALTVMTASLELGASVYVLWALAIFAAHLVPMITAFALDRPPLRTWLALLMVPRYLLWKLFLGIRGTLVRGNRAWIRTRRHE